MEVFSTAFMIDGKVLGFLGELITLCIMYMSPFCVLASDSDKNITLYQYQPDSE